MTAPEERLSVRFASRGSSSDTDALTRGVEADRYRSFIELLPVRSSHDVAGPSFSPPDGPMRLNGERQADG